MDLQPRAPLLGTCLSRQPRKYASPSPATPTRPSTGRRGWTPPPGATTATSHLASLRHQAPGMAGQQLLRTSLLYSGGGPWGPLVTWAGSADHLNEGVFRRGGDGDDVVVV